MRRAFAVLLSLLSLPIIVSAADVPWLEQVQSHPQAPEKKLTPLLPPGSKADLVTWTKRREELRELWLKQLGPMPARPSEPVWTVLRTDELPDVTRQLIEYESEPGVKTEAYLLRPSGPIPARTRAGVVALHPTTPRTAEIIAGVEGDAYRQTGLILARHGFVVICPRCFLWDDAKSYNEAAEKQRKLRPDTLPMHKMLNDAQRAVDILIAQPDVNPQRIGTCGHSLGAKEAFYLAAFDERVRAAVSSEGGIEISATNWDAPWYLGPIARSPEFKRDHHELVALIAPRAFLVMGGEVGANAADGNRSWPYLQAAVPIYQLYGDQLPLGLLNHGEGHALSPASTEKLVEWLQVYLAE